MWTKVLKSSFALGIFLIAAQSFSATELSLHDLRQEVLKDNVDIRIQYEKYYQSQKGVSVALGEFLPSANISLININATLAILQSVVPTPSDWFVYQSSKELQLAEKYTTESIKLNILEGLTVNFVNIKHQEALMVSLKEQEMFLAEVFEEVKKKEALGLASASDVFLAKRNLMQHRQDMYALDSLLIAEKQSILIALNKSPSEELILAELPDENSDVIPTDAHAGIEMAINNSTELVSNTYQAEAARFMVASRKWSFISFNGIGFDYGSKLAIERSRARVIELQREQIALKIKNQVFAAYHDLDVLDQRLDIQADVLEETRLIEVRNTELFRNNALSLKEYLDSKNSLAAEERAYVKLSMERRIKVTQIKRFLGFDASLSSIDTNTFSSLNLVKEIKHGRRGSQFVWMNVEAPKELKSMIFSVTYSVENLKDPQRVLMMNNNFFYSFQASRSGSYLVKAKIMLMSGDVIEKDEVVVVE